MLSHYNRRSLAWRHVSQKYEGGWSEEKHDNVDDDAEGDDSEDDGDDDADRDLKEKHTSDQSKRSRTAKPPRVYLQR